MDSWDASQSVHSDLEQHLPGQPAHIRRSPGVETQTQILLHGPHLPQFGPLCSIDLGIPDTDWLGREDVLSCHSSAGPDLQLRHLDWPSPGQLPPLSNHRSISSDCCCPHGCQLLSIYSGYEILKFQQIWIVSLFKDSEKFLRLLLLTFASSSPG